MKRSKFTGSIVALLLVLALAFTPITVFAAPTQALTVEQLMENQGRGITRGEFVMFLNACLSLPEGAGAGFMDVPENHPYAADISAAQAIGYIRGDGGGTFRPDDIITGAEASICINYFLGFDLSKVPLNNQTTVPSWAKPAVSNLLDLGMLTLSLTDKTALTVSDAVSYATALMTALMFGDGPYALMQADENDDFFAYNNRQYLATATIAPGNIFAMSFTDPDFVVENQMSTLLAKILAGGGEVGSDEWKISELHKMYMDVEGRAQSLEKIIPIIDEIRAVKNISELNALAAKYSPAVNLQGFYGIGAYSDALTDNTKWCALVVPGSTMLGARDYYADIEALAPIHAILKQYIASVLSYVGETDNLESRATAMFAVDQGNALASMPQELLSDPYVLFTKSSWEELDKIAVGSGTMSYDPRLREALKDANVYCPDTVYIEHVEALYTEENLGVLKDFAIFNTIITFGQFIGDDFNALSNDLAMVMFGAATEGVL